MTTVLNPREGVLAVALFSRKVDYALLILSYLHHRPEGGCAREIAERFGLKPPFAANVLKLLCRRGLVRGRRGVKGGYVLARPAAEVVLSELLDGLGEPFHLAECNQPEGCCREQVCPVKGAVAALDERIRAMLRGVTLAELCGAAGPPSSGMNNEGARFALTLIASGADA
jgi:Rrf2 family protein